jgi:hypothetical protein
MEPSTQALWQEVQQQVSLDNGIQGKRIALLLTLQLIDPRVSFLSPFPLALLRWRLTLH